MTEHHCTYAGGCTKTPPLELALCRTHAGKEGPGHWLADIRPMWRALDPRHGATDNGGRSGSLASQRSPVRLAVTALTDRRRGDVDAHLDSTAMDGLPSVYAGLHRWARQVRDARRLSTPTSLLSWRETVGGPACLRLCDHDSCLPYARWRSITIDAELTVETERQVLVDHLDWCEEQDWWREMKSDVRAVWSALRTVHGEPPPKPAASCWLPVGDELCGGPIWSDPGKAWCGKCGASWEGLALLRIAPVLDGAA